MSSCQLRRYQWGGELRPAAQLMQPVRLCRCECLARLQVPQRCQHLCIRHLLGQPHTVRKD